MFGSGSTALTDGEGQRMHSCHLSSPNLGYLGSMSLNLRSFCAFDLHLHGLHGGQRAGIGVEKWLWPQSVILTPWQVLAPGDSQTRELLGRN